MLVFLISTIEWAKLIIGILLIMAGAILFLRPFVGSLSQSTGDVSSSTAYAIMFGTGLITLATGFYIAGW